jgi:uncharacterized membrane protein
MKVSRLNDLQRMIVCVLSTCLLMLTSVAAVPGQTGTAAVRVEVRAAGVPLEGAKVTIGTTTVETSGTGVVEVTVAPGPTTIAVSAEGYLPATATVTATSGTTQSVVLYHV